MSESRTTTTGESSSVTRHSPAATLHYRAAGRRATGSAPVDPRGSGRSRRASPQRQTRPEARTHARAAFQAVRLVQKLLPTLCVETVDNSGICEPQALGTQAGTPDATLSRPGAVCHPERRECATKWGTRNGNPRKEREPSGDRAPIRPAWTVTGTRRRYCADGPARVVAVPRGRDGAAIYSGRWGSSTAVLTAPLDMED